VQTIKSGKYSGKCGRQNKAGGETDFCSNTQIILTTTTAQQETIIEKNYKAITTFTGYSPNSKVWQVIDSTKEALPRLMA